MRIIYTALFALLTAPVFAQEDTLKAKELEEVIVSTGQYKPQSVKNSVYQVRVITGEQIRKQSAAKLQDVLNSQLNIRFSQDLATGGSDITMMGLSGQNVKILIDGVPMIGRQGTSNEININQVEVNSIERIEIIEGPMSVIYGADALAGVINIITKKAGRDKFSVTARVQEETVGKEYSWFDEGIHNQYVGASGRYKNWYAGGGIGRNLFQGWKDTATGRELTWHKKDQIVGNALVGYRNEKLDIYYRLDGLDEIITNPANFPAGGNQPAIDQDYMTNRLMQQIQGSYRFNNQLSVNALASYTHFTRQVYSTLAYPNGDVRVATAPGLHSLSTFDGFTFRATAVYSPSKIVSFQPGVDINSETGEGERIKIGTQRITDYAFFLTSEIMPTHWLNIRPGIRVVHNSVYDAPPVIPSINTKLLLTKYLDFRLAYARGFRAPSLRELYYDFFDASHSISGNPNLEAEHSNSFTGSLTWNALRKTQARLNITLSGFYNDVDNMISFAVDAANPSVTTYVNIDKYKTRGTMLTGQLIAGNLDASVGFGYTGRYNAYSEAYKDLPEFKWSPELSAVVSYSFPKVGLSANLYYKFTGKLPYYQQVSENGQTVVRLAETEGYHWADLTLNKKLVGMLTVNAGIRNLFDVTAIGNSAVSGGAHTSTGARPIGNGRSYFMGLVFNWSKK